MGWNQKATLRRCRSASHSLLKTVGPVVTIGNVGSNEVLRIDSAGPVTLIIDVPGALDHLHSRGIC